MLISNHTQIPNEFIENMGIFSGNEIKIFLAICRKTIGWHKLTDRVSYSQLYKITGIKSHNTLKKSITGLIEKRIIIQELTKFGYKYDINFKIGVSKNDTPLSKFDIVGVSKNDTPLSKFDSTKETNIKEIDKETNINNIYTQIFNYWNDKNIIKHNKLTPGIKENVDRVLKSGYKEDDILDAINNYSIVLNSDLYYFNYKWGLVEFLRLETSNRNARFEKFLTVRDPLTNFKAYGKGGNNAENRPGSSGANGAYSDQEQREYVGKFSKNAEFETISNKE